VAGFILLGSKEPTADREEKMIGFFAGIPRIYTELPEAKLHRTEIFAILTPFPDEHGNYKRKVFRSVPVMHTFGSYHGILAPNNDDPEHWRWEMINP
jgi:hypothetical protein